MKMENKSKNKLVAHPYIAELLALELATEDRHAFHEKVKPLLLKMGADVDFLKLIVRRNFDDPGYLNQEWSLYNIPFFYIHETADFILKLHFFPTVKNWKPGIAAHAIHHHNNYLLTTNAFFGSGYESLLFEKKVEMDPITLRTKMNIRKHFHQKDWNPSKVDSWEPHIVFVPEKFSATLLIWTPEKKRSTDALRNVGFLKAIKGPLRRAIQFLGLADMVGISHGKTYQWYAAQDSKSFMAVEEANYFAPSKAAKGPEIDDYSMQMVFGFMQRLNLVETDYLNELMTRNNTPTYYKNWIAKAVSNEFIEDVYHREEINIPQGKYTISDIYKAAGQAEENPIR